LVADEVGSQTGLAGSNFEIESLEIEISDFLFMAE
jgi:hypothetical protein